MNIPVHSGDPRGSAAMFETLFKLSDTIIILLDREGKMIHMNPAAEKATGYEESEVSGRPFWNIFIHREMIYFAKERFFEISRFNAAAEIMMEIQSKNAGIRLVKWRVTSFPDDTGSDKNVMATGIDISDETHYKELSRHLEKRLESTLVRQVHELEDSNKELFHLSRVDHLTGLYNRRHLDDVLCQMLKHENRRGETVSLLMCDVDHFKAYNDTYGHFAGDIALKKIGALLKRCTRRVSDIAARYGGEEFVLILSDTHPDGAGTVARCIMSKLSNKNIEHCASPTAPYLTMSIGVATISTDKISNIKELLALADRQLYAAKSGGRNLIRQATRL